jgi:hypothetical protein
MCRWPSVLLHFSNFAEELDYRLGPYTVEKRHVLLRSFSPRGLEHVSLEALLCISATPSPSTSALTPFEPCILERWSHGAVVE